MAELTVDNLCILLADLYGRSGVDDAIDACREFMLPLHVERLDAALERGHALLADGPDY